MNDVPVSLEKQNTRFEESEIPELSNVRKRFLLFADDLTIFSLTYEMSYKENIHFYLLKKKCWYWKSDEKYGVKFKNITQIKRKNIWHLSWTFGSPQ